MTIAVALSVIAGLLPGSAAVAAASTGSITGHLLDGTAPVGNVTVLVESGDGAFVGEARTDAAGAYTVSDLAPASYRVRFEFGSGYGERWHEKTFNQTGDLIAVTAGAASTADETVLPHGSLVGHVTHSDGTPAAGVQVRVNSASDMNLGLNAVTNANGNYTVAIVPAGSYTLNFYDTSVGLSQSAHQHIGNAPGDTFVVTNGASTTVDEQFLALGAIAGHVTDSGNPVNGGQVLAFGTAGQQVFGRINFDGSYRVPVFPDTYQLQFQLDDGLVEWAHQKLTQATADPITVSPGADTILDEAVIPTGTITGTLANPPGNPPLFFAQVYIDGGGQHVSTNVINGTWTAKVFPGTYTVMFQTSFGRQWATGKSSEATANTFTVASGQTTRADDTLGPTGSASITLTDSVTGSPVPTFCVNVSGLFNSFCTDSGTVLAGGLLPGSYTLFVSGADSYVTDLDTVTIASGQTTTKTIPAIPAATINATVTDAITGAPLTNMCLRAIAPDNPSSLPTGNGECTDGNGVAHVTRLRPGTYNLFVFAMDGVHGDQWVGAQQGTGEQKKAATITVGPGQSVSAPTIRMDKRGQLTGVIRDKLTGAPLAGAVASFATQNAGLGSGIGFATTDGAGRYTFTELGPYDWPIFYQAPGYASEWSGHTGNRLQANPVRVKAGKTRNHDERMSRGVLLSGAITSADGASVGLGGARVNLVSADSADDIGAVDTDADGHYQVRVMRRQNLALRLDAFVLGGKPEFFYVDSPDLAHASVVPIGRADLTVNITVPSS